MVCEFTGKTLLNQTSLESALHWADAFIANAALVIAALVSRSRTAEVSLNLKPAAVAPQVLFLGTRFGWLAVSSFWLVVRGRSFAHNRRPHIFDLQELLLRTGFSK